MPPIRTLPIVKPVRTERTHEENQERAYIAASRRSDRSLEARVESARRASEIHKKRTGRSLRVREEDVMNEEMYEEEDDDLPMQFRRINALNPGFAYSAFNERVNSYLQGQIGVRNYLHQAIYQANQANQANQNFNANQLFNNPLMQHNVQQQQFQMGMQPPQPGNHGRSASMGTPQGFASGRQCHNDAKAALEAMSPAAESSPSATRTTSSQPPTPHEMQQTGTTKSLPSPSSDNPLTTQLAPNMQQLVDGQLGTFGVQPFQMDSAVPTPSNYSYHPNLKPAKRDSGASLQTGLNQTLSGYGMYNNTYASGPLYQDPQSSLSAPGALDYGQGFDMLNSDFSLDGVNNDSKYPNCDYSGSGGLTGNANNSGQVTPAGLHEDWNIDDYLSWNEPQTT